MRPIDHLLDLMATLRDPGRGCPWDLEQTFRTIAPYTVEEAYEVADAIDHDDMAALREELGDLLFQVVFHARMAEEAGLFGFDDVAGTIADKMIRRHPHVFGEADRHDAGAQVAAWEAIKAGERAGKGHDSVLDGIARSLPPMTRALKLQGRAARVGFDWSEAGAVLDKIKEEVAELEAEIHAASPVERLEDEVGDLLFACVNLARKLAVDPERALNRTNGKFTRRFQHVETSLRKRDTPLDRAGLEEMEDLWQEAKGLERQGGKTP